ncbi:MAG: response regulator [Planctomycetes bacterium]|nr:response regulator [Planctomycetota bacterium]
MPLGSTEGWGSAELLLVEDNPGDVRLILEACREANIRAPVRVVADGVEALAYLRREAGYVNAKTPALILLDLNLPRKSGHEVLEEIKRDPDLRRIPVVILSISRSKEDLVSAYSHHANCFITKPPNMDQFIDVVKGLEAFWLRIVQLPTQR